MKLLLGKHELAYVNNVIKVCSIEYLTSRKWYESFTKIFADTSLKI